MTYLMYIYYHKVHLSQLNNLTHGTKASNQHFQLIELKRLIGYWNFRKEPKKTKLLMPKPESWKFNRWKDGKIGHIEEQNKAL